MVAADTGHLVVKLDPTDHLIQADDINGDWPADAARLAVGRSPESRRASLCHPACGMGGSARTIRHSEGVNRTCRRNVRGRECGMDEFRRHVDGVRSRNDAHTRRLCSDAKGHDGVTCDANRSSRSTPVTKVHPRLSLMARRPVPGEVIVRRSPKHSDDLRSVPFAVSGAALDERKWSAMRPV